MPVGYSSRCKVCNSQHRATIEKWAKEDGLNSRAISAKLAEEFSESISHKSIWQHLREHFDVEGEVREKYEQAQKAKQESQEIMDQQVEKRLSEVEMLDELARKNFDLFEKVREVLQTMVEEERPRLPQGYVELLAVTTGEVRQQIKQRAALLGEDPEGKKADAVQSLVDLIMAADDE